MVERDNEELLTVDSILNLPFIDSAGLYFTRLLTEMKETGRILAVRCPECKRVIFPPNITCGRCKTRIEDEPGNWIELSDTGTVVTFAGVEAREVDRVTGKLRGSPNPNALIRLDNGDEDTFMRHILKETDLSKIWDGMRVKAVWKPKEKRHGKLSDIQYFKTIPGQIKGES